MIELWSIHHVGVILLSGNGVLYMNQTCGTLCAHPRARGFYIPLPARFQPGDRDELVDCSELSLEDVSQFLTRMELDHILEARSPQVPERAPDGYEEGEPIWGEAWVPVRVKESLPEYDPLTPLFKSYRGRDAIVTYQNSD